MTRYEDISDLAVDWAHRKMEEEWDCQCLAHSIVTGYISFLDCPQDRVSLFRLDKDLNPKGEPESIRRDLSMIQLDDGFYYFSFRIEYKIKGDPDYTQHNIRLGVKLCDTTATVRVVGPRVQRDFEIDTTVTDCFNQFFNAVFENTKKSFPASASKPFEYIGFVRSQQY